MDYSVIITTYNGEKFIIQQLNSILTQTVPPSEVIIIDDHSNDDTCQLIENFIYVNKLASWTLYINPYNIGWKKNFISAIEKASNELIFLSDQDDIWLPKKAQKLISCLQNHPDLNILSTNFDKIDEHGNVIEKKDNFSSLLTYPKFSYKNFQVQRPGCTYAFKKTFFEKIRPFWIETMPHDALLWWYGTLTNSLGIFPESLIFYRRHSKNVSGNKLTRNEILQKLNDSRLFLDSLNHNLPSLNKDISYTEVQKVVHDLIQYNDLRIKAYSSYKISSMYKALTLYKKCYASYSTPSNHPLLSEIKNFLFTR